MKLKRTLLSGTIPVFGHDKAMQLAQGGFNLDLTGLAAGATVPAASVLGYDEATRVAKLLKTAKVIEAVASNGVNIKVAKGHLLQNGDILTSGGAAKAVTGINKDNAAYDVVTVSATLGAIPEAGTVYAAAADVADGAAFAVGPRGLLWNSVVVPADDYVFVDVVIRHANVYQRRIPAVTDSIKAKLPNIIFSQSF